MQWPGLGARGGHASRGPQGPGRSAPRGRCRENAENMYYFSELALTLNEHEEGVAPTDSRLRPDQRLMEKGHWDEANTEKQRLEEKQRVNRRRRLEACARGCGAEEGEAGQAGGGSGKRGAWGAGSGAVGEGLGAGSRGTQRRQAADSLPAALPSREGGRGVCAAVVREEAGPADRGDGLHVQGRLLGGQGEAGLAHVPQHLLSTAHSCKYRRLHRPVHLLFNALKLVLNGPSTLPFSLFF